MRALCLVSIALLALGGVLLVGGLLAGLVTWITVR